MASAASTALLLPLLVVVRMALAIQWTDKYQGPDINTIVTGFTQANSAKEAETHLDQLKYLADTLFDGHFVDLTDVGSDYARGLFAKEGARARKEIVEAVDRTRQLLHECLTHEVTNNLNESTEECRQRYTELGLSLLLAMETRLVPIVNKLVVFSHQHNNPHSEL